ncbi:hypothetical protein CTI12_AA427700 [Artemisia annua]|uniref:Endonuclease/exonuclease/phosphatase domain-containing protein n=1 Tax=Artemisia annua TaxID=35608 RepID=A0A2U1LR24_ARTAN|nr:hypothetical protein CTI12_AA427700 [Artemisia annua]
MDRAQVIRRGKDINNKTYLDGKYTDETSVRGGKREAHPTSSNSSGDGRLNKKRKENEDDEGDAISNMIENTSGLKEIDFEEANKTNAFNEGVDNGIGTFNKKRGRKSLKKAKKVARMHGVGGSGTNEKGVSEAGADLHVRQDGRNLRNNNGGFNGDFKVAVVLVREKGDGKKETFVFKSTGRADSDSKGCSINMEQVKDIGEIIGVSWAKAEKVNMSEVEIVGREDDKKEDQQGFGEAEKKGWVKSIIREERPDVIGLQETKCGVIDDMVIEDLWGGRGFGFTQLAANGNLGGVLLIWDTRSFTYKDGMGDERFVAVKGEWKARNKKVGLACIYGPHVGRQKASLWDRIRGLMDSSKGAWCIFGDLNVVRGGDERRNSQRSRVEKISVEDALLVEKEFSEGEILEAVRGCGGDRDPALKRFQWKMLFWWKKSSRRRSRVEKISVEDALLVEKEFSEGEILEAVRGCGGDRDPALKRFQWKMLFWWKKSSRRRSRVEKISVEDALLVEKEFSEGEILEAVRGCGGDRDPALKRFQWKMLFWWKKSSRRRSRVEKISVEDALLVEKEFSEGEILEAVRGCGGDRDPALKRFQWKMLFWWKKSSRRRSRVEKISVEDALLVEKEFSEGEILEAVRGCGGDRDPALKRFQWKMLFWWKKSSRRRSRVEKISVEDALLVEKEFSEGEILEAVRGCGGDRDPALKRFQWKMLFWWKKSSRRVKFWRRSEGVGGIEIPR